jgi:gliding motility-associated-like protein
MISSKTLISGLLTSAIKRAPNGKLYAVGAQGSGGGVALHVVNRPNLAGAACDFVPHGFALAQRTYTYFGLPNLSTVFYPKKIYSTITDSTLCSGPRTLSAGDLSGRNYVWGDSALGPTRVVDSPGTYWVRYQVPVNTPCKYENHVDTFKVGFRFTTTTIFTTTINSGRCQADTLVIQATNLKGINYLWQDDITGQQRKINKAGIYWISYEIDSLCEHHIDSFIITYPEKDYKVSFHTDTLVCQNEPVLFRNTSAIHFNNFSWHFGEGSGSGVDHPQYVYSHPGSYRVMLIGSIDGVCPDTAYQAIVVDQTIPTHFLTDRNNICAGEAIIFTTQTDSTLKAMSWKFGDGAKTISEKEKIHHTYETAGIMPVVLTTAYRACPESSFTDTVYVYRPPDVYLGSDTAFCLNGAPILLKNLEAPPTGAYRNLWNTGATTASINVVQPGAYSLTVSTEPLGCSTTESVIINKDCYIAIPNAFTPNDDGRNDYFFPRQLLSAHITGFKMRLFNRWGQTVFETASINGRGWDGRLNGNNQPEGVYTYFIDVEIDETRKERYQGNVTLMR